MGIARRPSRNQSFLRREQADGIEGFVLVSAGIIAVHLRYVPELSIKATVRIASRVFLSADTVGEVGLPEFDGAIGFSHRPFLHSVKARDKATFLPILKGIKKLRLEKSKVEKSIKSPCALLDPDFIQGVRGKMVGINLRQTSLSLRALVTPRDKAA